MWCTNRSSSAADPHCGRIPLATQLSQARGGALCSLADQPELLRIYMFTVDLSNNKKIGFFVASLRVFRYGSQYQLKESELKVLIFQLPSSID